MTEEDVLSLSVSLLFRLFSSSSSSSSSSSFSVPSPLPLHWYLRLGARGVFCEPRCLDVCSNCHHSVHFVTHQFFAYYCRLPRTKHIDVNHRIFAGPRAPTELFLCLSLSLCASACVAVMLLGSSFRFLGSLVLRRRRIACGPCVLGLSCCLSFSLCLAVLRCLLLVFGCLPLLCRQLLVPPLSPSCHSRSALRSCSWCRACCDELVLLSSSAAELDRQR